MDAHSFRFRLERVRALRERREEQAKQEFGTAMQARQSCLDEVTRAADRITAARDAQLHAGGDALGAHQFYLERVESAHRLTLQELERSEQELQVRRTAMTKASQDREALERLKQKGLADHRRELARLEQITLDEIAGNGYRRQVA